LAAATKLTVVIAFVVGVPGASAADVKSEIVLGGLQYPSAIVLRPGGGADKYELFIAEAGSGRVLKWSNHDRTKADVVISGFPATATVDRTHFAGPQSLLFLDPGLLAVGSTATGNQLLDLYELPDEGHTISADHTTTRGAAAAAPANGEPTVCTSLTRTRVNETVPDALVMIIRGDRDASLVKCRIQAGVVGAPRPFSSVDLARGLAVPGAVATSNSGRIVVASGNRLAFVQPVTGQIELDLKTELSAVSGLAYSTITDNLYAADFDRGILRVEDASEIGRPASRTVKIIDTSHVTGLAFAPDGALYFTTAGAGDHDGALQMLTGEL
jgi:hypothetical protein